MFSWDRVQSFVYWFGRSCLIAMLTVGLLELPAIPAYAAADKAVGVVIQSQIGRLGNANLAIGTSVFAGDSLWTDIGGGLRVKVGSGQVYLLSSSSMTMGQEDGTVLAAVTRGTAGFSATPTDRLDIVIPQGLLRAASGQSGYGQVTILNEKEVVISSFRGALELDNAGEIHTLDEGKAYHVTILDDEAQKPEGAGTQDQVYPVRTKRRRKKLAVALFFLGGAAIGSYFLYDRLTESPSKFN